MGDKINYKVKRRYVNVGTEENPEWIWLDNPFESVEIVEANQKIPHLDKQN